MKEVHKEKILIGTKKVGPTNKIVMYQEHVNSVPAW